MVAKAKELNPNLVVFMFDDPPELTPRVEISSEKPDGRITNIWLTKEEFLKMFDLAVEMGWITRVTVDSEMDWFVFRTIKNIESLPFSDKFIVSHQYQIVPIPKGAPIEYQPGWKLYAGPFSSYFAAEHYVHFAFSNEGTE